MADKLWLVERVDLLVPHWKVERVFPSRMSVSLKVDPGKKDIYS
jgi:hypothetical protein